MGLDRMWKSSEISTTTWPERHRDTFADLGKHLAENFHSPLTVLEVGPGAVTRLLKDRMPAGVGKDLPWLANRYRTVLRNVDGLLRRLTPLPLGSYEPGELKRVLPVGSRLIVADISRSVIEAVSRQYGDIEARVFDFQAGPFTEPVEVVVCLCVLVRASEPAKLFANLYRSIRPGGVLVMDERSRVSFGGADMPLEKIDGQIWRVPTR